MNGPFPDGSVEQRLHDAEAEVAQLKAAAHEGSSCTMLAMRLNVVERERDEALDSVRQMKVRECELWAEVAVMRRALESWQAWIHDGKKKSYSADAADLTEAALASEAGEGWLSPEGKEKLAGRIARLEADAFDNQEQAQAEREAVREACALHVERHSCVSSCCDSQPSSGAAKDLADCLRALDLSQVKP